ncbi:MAG TPA: PRC-barrel domain-containing protein [Polyangia bacterium]|nr:PRC-barrel domain-containing protein [Polyangia bacterium]
MEITDVDLRDRTVIGADGNAIGQVVAVILDSDAWSVKAVRIKLRSNVAEQVGADHSLFRAGTIDVATDHVQSVGDAVVLTVSADGLRGAKSAAPQQTQPPAS